VSSPTANPRILVVEDEDDLRSLTTFSLEAQGFDVYAVGNAMEAFEWLEVDVPDLVLLDVMLPVISGFEVLQRIRATGMTPVILLTALESVEHRVRGLELGADAYLTKPFDVVELASHVHAVIRRTRGGTVTESVIQLEGLEVDRDKRKVLVRGEEVEMADGDFDLLAFLASSPGRVFTKHQLLDAWHAQGGDHAASVVDSVERVRHLIEVDPQTPRWVQTVEGIGYKFERRSAERLAAEERAFQEDVRNRTAALGALAALVNP
jgi:DNA-binding response OmpR family regulator